MSLPIALYEYNYMQDSFRILGCYGYLLVGQGCIGQGKNSGK